MTGDYVHKIMLASGKFFSPHGLCGHGKNYRTMAHARAAVKVHKLKGAQIVRYRIAEVQRFVVSEQGETLFTSPVVA